MSIASVIELRGESWEAEVAAAAAAKGMREGCCFLFAPEASTLCIAASSSSGGLRRGMRGARVGLCASDFARLPAAVALGARAASTSLVATCGDTSNAAATLSSDALHSSSGPRLVGKCSKSRHASTLAASSSKPRTPDWAKSMSQRLPCKSTNTLDRLRSPCPKAAKGWKPAGKPVQKEEAAIPPSGPLPSNSISSASGATASSHAPLAPLALLAPLAPLAPPSLPSLPGGAPVPVRRAETSRTTLEAYHLTALPLERTLSRWRVAVGERASTSSKQRARRGGGPTYPSAKACEGQSHLSTPQRKTFIASSATRSSIASTKPPGAEAAAALGLAVATAIVRSTPPGPKSSPIALVGSTSPSSEPPPPPPPNHAAPSPPPPPSPGARRLMRCRRSVRMSAASSSLSANSGSTQQAPAISSATHPSSRSPPCPASASSPCICSLPRCIDHLVSPP